MCFAGFLNHHKFRTNQKDLVIIRPFGSPRSLDWHLWRPWRPHVAKKTMDVYDVFSFDQYKRFEKREANWSPKKGIYATDVTAEISLNHDALHQVFYGAWSRCNKDNSSPQTKHRGSQVKKIEIFVYLCLPGRCFFPKSLFLHCSFQVVPYEYHNEPTIHVQMCNMREEVLPGEPSENAVTTST